MVSYKLELRWLLKHKKSFQLLLNIVKWKKRIETQSPVAQTEAVKNGALRWRKTEGLSLPLLFCLKCKISRSCSCYFLVGPLCLLWNHSPNRCHDWSYELPSMSSNCSPQNPPSWSVSASVSTAVCEGAQPLALHKWAWSRRTHQCTPLLIPHWGIQCQGQYQRQARLSWRESKQVLLWAPLSSEVRRTGFGWLRREEEAR